MFYSAGPNEEIRRKLIQQHIHWTRIQLSPSCLLPARTTFRNFVKIIITAKRMKPSSFILKWKFKEYLYNFIQVFLLLRNLFEFHILFQILFGIPLNAYVSFFLSSYREGWEEIDHCRTKRKVYELYETHLIWIISKLELRKVLDTFILTGQYDTRKL